MQRRGDYRKMYLAFQQYWQQQQNQASGLAVAVDWFAVVVATRLNLQGSSGSNARGDDGCPKTEFVGTVVQTIVFNVLWQHQ